VDRASIVLAFSIVCLLIWGGIGMYVDWNFSVPHWFHVAWQMAAFFLVTVPIPFIVDEAKASK
jgi:hypothetical protein